MSLVIEYKVPTASVHVVRCVQSSSRWEGLWCSWKKGYLFFFNFFFNFYLFLGQREREHERGRGREREGDTESEAGSRL